MADDAEIRAVLREHGHDVPARGKIRADLLAAYDQITAASGAGPAGDYDAGVTGDDFTAAADPPQDEQKPRRPGRGPRIRMPKAKPKGGRSGGRAHKRIPVDRLVERGWEFLARLVMPLDRPVGQCLALQSPVAGLLLEDIVRDTVVDKVLQPVARAEERAEKGLALIAPPLLVAAIERAQELPDADRMMREAVLVPLLRESLVLWVKVAGDKVEEKARRDQEMGPVNERVDLLLQQIFAAPAPPSTVPGHVVEDEDVAAAQATVGV